MASKYQPHLEYANFICKFGDVLNLADMVSEVVIPAFLTQGHSRKTSDATYFFLNQGLEEIDTELGKIPCLYGRLVKDTFIQRSHIFQDGELRDAAAVLETAETSLFLLTLDTHKLVYLKETKNAPGFLAFRSTVQKFLNVHYEQFIRSLQEDIQALEYRSKEDVEQYLIEKGLWKEGANILDDEDDLDPPESKRRVQNDSLTTLRRYIPKPNLDIVALSSEDSLEAFLNRFSLLSTVRVTLINTNDEEDMEEFIRSARLAKEEVGAEKTAIVHNNPRGLKKDEVLNQLKAVATQGNATTHLEGKDHNNLRLDGTEDKFKIRIPQKALPDFSAVSERVKHLVNSFQSAVQSKVISLQPVPESTKKKLDEIQVIDKRENGTRQAD